MENELLFMNNGFIGFAGSLVFFLLCFGEGRRTCLLEGRGEAPP